MCQAHVLWWGLGVVVVGVALTCGRLLGAALSRDQQCRAHVCEWDSCVATVCSLGGPRLTCGEFLMAIACCISDCFAVFAPPRGRVWLMLCTDSLSQSDAVPLAIIRSGESSS